MDVKCLKNLGVLLKEQTPHILTGAATVGVIATGISAAKAAPKAKERLEKLKNPTTLDKVKVVVPVYAPTVFIGSVTIGCVLGVDHIHAKRYAALAGTCAIAKSQLEAHKDKVAELFGTEKAKLIDREIAKDDAKKKANESSVMYLDDSPILCKDEVTGLTFKSTMFDIQRAANDVNRNIVMDGYANLTEFYEALDANIVPPDLAEKIRWGTDYDVNYLDVEFGGAVDERGKPYLTFTYEYDLRG